MITAMKMGFLLPLLMILMKIMVSCSGSSWATSNAVSLGKAQEALTSSHQGDTFLKCKSQTIFSCKFLTESKIFLSGSFSSLARVMSFTLGPLSRNFFRGSLSFRFSPFREREKGLKPGAYRAQEWAGECAQSLNFCYFHIRVSSKGCLELNFCASSSTFSRLCARTTPSGHDFAELDVNGCVRDRGFHHNEQSNAKGYWWW